MSRAAALAAALLAALALASARPQEGSPEARESTADEAWRARLVDDGRTPALADLSESDCVRCHAGIAEEWRWSAHATAWQDEHYQSALLEIRRKRSCWGCHVPQPLAGGDVLVPPPPREEHRQLGVDCVACHLDTDGETVLGPSGLETDAHPTRRSPLFGGEDRDSLCIGCHATTIGPVLGVAQDFVDTAQHELGDSCVGCHMPAVERPIAEDEDGTPLQPRRGRSHRLATPRDPLFLPKAFLVRAERTGDGARLALENLAGHGIPGLLERSFAFDVELVDADGTTVANGRLVVDAAHPLPVEEERSLDLAGEGVALRVRATHDAPGFAAPTPFLERELALPQR